MSTNTNKKVGDGLYDFNPSTVNCWDSVGKSFLLTVLYIAVSCLFLSGANSGDDRFFGFFGIMGFSQFWISFWTVITMLLQFRMFLKCSMYAEVMTDKKQKIKGLLTSLLVCVISFLPVLSTMSIIVSLWGETNTVIAIEAIVLWIICILSVYEVLYELSKLRRV